jgi:hypothetical protein
LNAPSLPLIIRKTIDIGSAEVVAQEIPSGSAAHR